MLPGGVTGEGGVADSRPARPAIRGGRRADPRLRRRAGPPPRRAGHVPRPARQWSLATLCFTLEILLYKFIVKRVTPSLDWNYLYLFLQLNV